MRSRCNLDLSLSLSGVQHSSFGTSRLSLRCEPFEELMLDVPYPGIKPMPALRPKSKGDLMQGAGLEFGRYTLLGLYGLQSVHISWRAVKLFEFTIVDGQRQRMTG
ncbi:hypothetical protein FCM35_KLT12684 [Carex littledalei]|uniref:Uncharacterized protein n=1 Tax=Carex littledalei TaxID=544730 RepID=A0A833VEF4_9POAL|nr:hypothetical protein FCM35_KLT12684 [Carex littledalei]